MIIPQKYKSFKEGHGRTYKREMKVLRYKTPQGWIDVVVWHQYPSYDFIFGFPEPTHKLYKQEAAFVQYRDNRLKNVEHGFYLDWGEMEVWGNGFDRLRKHWKNRKRSSMISFAKRMGIDLKGVKNEG